MNRLSCWLILASVWILDATVVYARAGGGGSYSSGGGSSSSSSSSYSSGGSSGGGSGDFGVFDAILFAAFIPFAIYFLRKSRQTRAAMAAQRRDLARARVAVIRERDPGFRLEAFEARVESAFLRIQDAWSRQDLSEVRGFMSDGLHERFSIQIREQQSRGFVNQMSNVSVQEIELLEVSSSPALDVASVKIRAYALDVRLDARTKKVISGSRRNSHFVEVWSFIRGSQASSTDSPGLVEGNCPNCASPVDPKRVWACSSCGSALESAPPDWVLSEITQASEWSSVGSNGAIGLKEAGDRDPGLTVQQLEDRASVLFCRMTDGERTRSVGGLVSVCRPRFLDAVEKYFAATPEHTMEDAAVGAVTVRGILPGVEMDLALVEVKWSAIHIVGKARSPEAHRDLLVMSRRAGAQSQIGRCIVSAHCATCGAPDEDSLEGACGFCGEVLNDGRDWVVDRLLRIGEDEATELLAELANSADPGAADTILPKESGSVSIPLAAPTGAGRSIDGRGIQDRGGARSVASSVFRMFAPSIHRGDGERD